MFFLKLFFCDLPGRSLFTCVDDWGADIYNRKRMKIDGGGTGGFGYGTKQEYTCFLIKNEEELIIFRLLDAR